MGDIQKVVEKLKRRHQRRIEREIFALPNAAFVHAFQRLNERYFSYPVFVSHEPVDDLIRVEETGARIFVGRPSRLKLYQSGVQNRLKFVAGQYFLDRIEITPGDLFIDIGANIGEVSRFALDRGARTIAIEPESTEIRALKRNVSGKENYVVEGALWKEETELTLYSKNSSGDSSLLEISDSEATSTIKTTTLDHLYQNYGNGQRVKALKLEAEGAEPEILDGASKMLPYVDYIAADVGPERGVMEETTLIPVLDRLTAAGFKPIAFEHQRVVMLFENSARVKP